MPEPRALFLPAREKRWTINCGRRKPPTPPTMPRSNTETDMEAQIREDCKPVPHLVWVKTRAVGYAVARNPQCEVLVRNMIGQENVIGLRPY